MIEVLKTLKAIVIDGYEEKINTSFSTFSLSETAKQATCKEVKFRKDLSDVLVFKFDKAVKDEAGVKIQEPFVFFKKGIAQSKADFLIFYPFEKKGESKLFIFVCNLKSGARGNNEDQLNSGKSLAQFLAQHAMRCCNFENSSTSGFIKFEDKDIKIIKILFSGAKPLKQPLKIEHKNLKVPYFELSCAFDVCYLDKYCSECW